MLRKTILAIFTLLFVLFLAAQQRVRIEINSLPTNTPANSALFIAGNFNSWDPQDQHFKFQKNEKGYFIDLSLNNGKYEYKITRGGWDKVECTNEGRDIGNRNLNVEANATVGISVGGWKDLFASSNQPRRSTAGKNVRIIDTAFFIPQLNRTRRIWVYVPPHI